MIRISHPQRLPVAIAALGFLFLGLFLLYPLANVFGASFLDAAGEKFTFANYTKLLGRPFYHQAIANTLGIGITATIVTTALAVPFAFAVARLPVPGKSVLLALASAPLVLPSFVSAYALVLLFGRSGIVTHWLQSIGVVLRLDLRLGRIVTAYTLTLYPYVLLPTIAAFKAVDVSMEEAAQNLGSSPARTVRTVILPIVMPAILAGGLLVLIETLENFGVPFVLAEDMPIFAVEAFKLFIGETAANPSSAGVLGVLLILTTTGVLLVQRRFLSSRRFATNARQVPPLLRVGSGMRLAATVYCWTIVTVALVPFFAIVVLSFMEFRGPVLHEHFSLDNFAFLLGRGGRPLLNTLCFASAAAICATLVGVPVGYVVARQRNGMASALDVIATLPFAVAGYRAGDRLHCLFQYRTPGADRRSADPGPGLHRTEGAVHRALGRRHRAPDRRFAGGGLDQPRPLAAADPAQDRRAADAGRHPERPGARLGDGGVRTQRHHRAV